MDSDGILKIMEGALKADTASFLSGNAFIALVGVGNTSQLKDCLIRLRDSGMKMLHIAIDMDYKTKESVANALKKIVSIAEDATVSYTIEEWDPRYKGIDEWVLFKTKY